MLAINDTIDPVTLAVIQNGLQAVAAEMDLSFMRTAFSPVISESFDRSDGVYDRATGEVICQGALGLPLFMGVMQFTTQSVIAHCPHLDPGDVVLVNDPYLGGTHLMDVKMVKPFFYRGRLFAYLANTGHWPDTGGRVPGGFTARATEIQQEGLRLPPVRFVRQGTIEQDILDIVLANIRVPEERLGDIQAQLGALAVGERRLGALLDRYGVETIENAMAELKIRSEQLMRAHIATIPDGVYESEAFIDSDAIDPEPLAIRLTLTVAGTDLTFDFSRSSPPCRGPLNSVLAATKSSVYIAVKHVFPDVPINAGCFAPLHIPDPDGTFLYAKYPRPVNGCSAEVTQRVIEAVFLALAEAIPDRLWAAPAGTSGNFTLGGDDPERGRRYIMYIFSGGGYGGYADGDGLTNGCSAIGISKIQPVEVCEQRYPILFEEYALREGSAGAGRHRGGFGVSYRARFLRGDAVASFMMDHGRFGPPGILGGEAGALNEIVIGRGGEELRPTHWSKDEDIRLRPGDWVQVRTPGGGGYGDPLARDPALVLRDVQRGYISPPDAERQYGVRLRATEAPGRLSLDVDEVATAALRAARGHPPPSPRRGGNQKAPSREDDGGYPAPTTV